MFQNIILNCTVRLDRHVVLMRQNLIGQKYLKFRILCQISNTDENWESTPLI